MSRPAPLPTRTLAGRALPWTLFALAAVAAAAFGALWMQERAEGERRAELQREVEAEARRFVEALTTFSSKTIERDVDEIRSFAAGQFEDEVDKLFSEETISAIEDARARSESELEALFVQRLEEGDASVFAVASVSIVNARSEEPRTELVRMEIGFVRAGERWKVDSVELFQSPGAPEVGRLG